MRSNGLGEKLLSIQSLSSVFLLLLSTLRQIFDSDLNLHFSTLMMRLLKELLKQRLLVLTQKRTFKPLIDLPINRLKPLESHMLVIVLSFHPYNDYAKRPKCYPSFFTELKRIFKH